MQARGAVKCTRRTDVPDARSESNKCGEKIGRVVSTESSVASERQRSGCFGDGGKAGQSRERRVCFGLSWVGFVTAVCWEREVPAGDQPASQPASKLHAAAQTREGRTARRRRVRRWGRSAGGRCRGLERVAPGPVPCARLRPQ